MAVAFYALSVVMMGLASAAHARTVLRAESAVAVKTVETCKSSASSKTHPARHCVKHCAACTLAEAPGLRTASISTVVLRLEIVARLDFKSRLGRDLDDTPADLRSRAPPVRV